MMQDRTKVAIDHQ